MRTAALTAATAAALLLLIAGPSLAQPAATSGGGAASAAGFDGLSPGEQKIARALFLAQHPTSGGPMALSLNQIAALKQKKGWGEVFKAMRAEGLVQAKSLGEVVSGYEHQLHAAHRTPSHGMVMTTASGRIFDAGAPRSHGDGARDGDADTDDASPARSGEHGQSAAARDRATQAGSPAAISGGGMHGGALGRGR